MTAVAGAALSWLSAHRADFRLGPHALEPDADPNASWKRVGELAQLCACVRRSTAPGSPLHGTATALVRHAWHEAGDGALFLDVQRLEPNATYPLEVYAAFADAGLRHPPYEELIGLLVRTRGWRTPELLPNRLLGVLNSEHRAGLAPRRRMDEPLRRTWLGALPEPWLFEKSAAYTLTHVVFHLTDWGHHPDTVPDDIAAYLHTWLPPWLDTCVEAQHWDLCGELLAVAASLPSPPAPDVTEDAWSALAAAQDGDGALPEVGRGPRGEDVPRVFVNCYHSTLVTAFAATLTVARRTGHPHGGDRHTLREAPA
ncbi:hypothetical protein ATE80_10720 [Streptomyces kanasensis]|uniref:DUF6895 domain-containing protein n=1 Tax=Streptomyces kanasensis TaxID=936756 RepID=A0A100Y6Y7_9ACTN|nr:hypothetical protein ATE80_10720 [Streptomyces kanasensis]